MDYCLYRLSFAQAIALIDARNERERKASEEAEKRAAERDDPNYVDPSKYKVNENTAPEALPTLSDLKAAFGAMMSG